MEPILGKGSGKLRATWEWDRIEAVHLTPEQSRTSVRYEESLTRFEESQTEIEKTSKASADALMTPRNSP
jgi:hypothetical protein